ncbi:arabinan endo-1,5-alpha-L-arabinosidase [Jonesia quinghaiensis]|uniref:arabinan endo-1,5-alpha-L-arabinosidase n=1 Tax=Jonesia quinghaiensis TaxID=262806 RepID=UPI000423CFFF|nr:arabinan endo-1,5-alpha-L-arabinosidase [Jonesia quinghaiensis]
MTAETQPLRSSISSAPTTWGLRNAHDPTVVRADDGLYVMMSTDACADGPAPSGVHIRTSPDLVTWDWHGTAFDGVPPSAHNWANAQGLWAPEVVRWRGAEGTDTAWRMLWSASSFGSRTSAIGLATAPTPLGPWHDEGIVVRTHHNHSSQNAIDACVTWDDQGRPWLTYGSFFSGLYALELDPITGMPRHPGSMGERIAARPRAVEGALEGPFLRAPQPGEPDNYNLFVSFDSLFNAYDVRVAHAPAPIGPYIDRAGNRLLDRRLMDDTCELDPTNVGTQILAGHQFPGLPGLIAPGHCSVFRDDDGTEFLVHHVRHADSPGQHEAQIRRLLLMPSGWPVVSPLPYGGESRETSTTLCDDSLRGTWFVLDLSAVPEQVPVPLPDGFPDHLRLAPMVVAQPVALPSGNLNDLGLVEGVTFPVTLPTGQSTIAFAGYRQAGDRLVHVSGYRGIDGTPAPQ